MCLLVLPTAATAGEKAVFCVLVPHFKDGYWLSVGYGLEQEAALNDIDLLFFEAGGYGARAAQIGQLDICVSRGVDAILIGTVTSDHPDLTEAIARVARDVPVYGLINALHSDALQGRVGVDWRDMGYVLGNHLRQLHPAGSSPKTAIFVTGPPESGWTGPLEAGLRDGLAGGAVTLQQIFGADTGLRQQLALTEHALGQYWNVDYLIGSAPAIEAAIGLLGSQERTKKPLLLATYVSHTIKRGLMNGTILAASFDDPMLQARMAIRQAASATSASKQRVGPDVVLLRKTDDDLKDIRTSPAEYFPSLQ